MRKNIADKLPYHAERRPDMPALKEYEETWTFADLNRTVQSLTDEMNPKKGRIVFLAHNSAAFLIVFMGAVKAGWEVFILDRKWPRLQIETTVQDIRPDVIFTDDLFYQGHTKYVHPKESTEQMTHKIKKITQWKDKKIESDLLFTGFTSGTTGNPKGYQRTHESWMESFGCSRDIFSVQPGHTVFSPGPFAHSLSLYAAVHALYEGACFSVSPSFKPAELITQLKDARHAVLYIVPSIINILAGLGETVSAEMIISSGSKWSSDSKRRTHELFPETLIYEFYGSSEASFISVMKPEDHEKYPASVGKAFPGVKLRLHGKEEGELLVSSGMLFEGYYKNPKASEEILQEGWLHTGDIAYINQEGYIFLKGRHHHKIITGGLNVYPLEVEEQLKKLKSVQEAAVTGEEDEKWGEKVTAWIKDKQGEVLTFEMMEEALKGAVASYKIPKKLIKVKEFPYTNSGKIDYKTLACERKQIE